MAHPVRFLLLQPHESRPARRASKEPAPGAGEAGLQPIRGRLSPCAPRPRISVGEKREKGTDWKEYGCSVPRVLGLCTVLVERLEVRSWYCALTDSALLLPCVLPDAMA